MDPKSGRSADVEFPSADADQTNFQVQTNADAEFPSADAEQTEFPGDNAEQTEFPSANAEFPTLGFPYVFQ